MSDDAFYVPVGKGTDVGMVKFLQDAEVAVHDRIKKKLGNIITVIPFSSRRNSQLVAVRHPEMDDVVRVFIKGAPEDIIDKCTRTHDLSSARTPMDHVELNYIKQDIISK